MCSFAAKNSTTAITKKTTEPTTCKSIDLFILNVFSSFVANLSIYSNEDVVPILTKYDSTLYNFGVEITQKKLDYDHTNTILVSALCNYIPMWVWIKSRFLFNSQRNLTCHIITVLMFALLVKVNSHLYWQASTQVCWTRCTRDKSFVFRTKLKTKRPS